MTQLETSLNTTMTNNNNDDDDDIELEWEEWDGQGSFLHHCLAGSIAGVSEHTLLYPVDTVKTHMQAYCASCPNNPANMNVMSNPGVGGGTKAVCTMKATTTTTTGLPSTFISSDMNTNVVSNSRPKVNPNGLQSPTPHGMLSTMRNLIQYGHASGLSPSVASSSSSALSSSSNNISSSFIRKSGSLSSTSIQFPSSATNTSSSSSSLPSHVSKGYTRLWRGVQTMATGCVPAHALYFSSYEYTKSLFLTHNNHSSSSSNQPPHLDPIGASIAGAISTFCHDLIMTPMDTIKQRMQLGHYSGMFHAFTQITQLEGWNGLYRSFGVTLLTNVPYGMVMVSTNEFLRQFLINQKSRKNNHSTTTTRLDLQTTMVSGCGAGFVAAAVTSPLDRIKTRLQTQRLALLQTVVIPPTPPSLSNTATTTTNTITCPKAAAAFAQALGESNNTLPKYKGLVDAFSSIVKEEGLMGLWRGSLPRVMTHTPAVAISWTTYETVKQFLADH